MKKFNRDLPALLSTIRELQEVKKTPFELNFLLMEIEKKIQEPAELYVKQIKILQKEIQLLSLEYCKKDSDGNPIYVYSSSKDGDGKMVYTQETYTGLGYGSIPEYDKRIEEIQNKLDELTKVEVEIAIDDLKPVSRGALAKIEWCGRYEKYLHDFIE